MAALPGRRCPFADRGRSCSLRSPIVGAFPTKWRFVGMAVGYLGLVVVLASVPIWNQMLLPYETPIAACLDFGGSR